MVPYSEVATGTGIAPMRAYIHRFFVEDVKSWEYKGLAWLFMGAANSDAKLYDDEFSECLKRFPGQFRVDYGGAHTWDTTRTRDKLKLGINRRCCWCV